MNRHQWSWIENNVLQQIHIQSRVVYFEFDCSIVVHALRDPETISSHHQNTRCDYLHHYRRRFVASPTSFPIISIDQWASDVLILLTIVEGRNIPSGWLRMYSTAWLTTQSLVQIWPESLGTGIFIPLWIASASLSGISMLNSYMMLVSCFRLEYMPALPLQ